MSRGCLSDSEGAAVLSISSGEFHDELKSASLLRKFASDDERLRMSACLCVFLGKQVDRWSCASVQIYRICRCHSTLRCLCGRVIVDYARQNYNNVSRREFRPLDAINNEQLARGLAVACLRSLA